MGRFECLKGAVFDFVTVRGWVVFFFLMKIGLIVLCLVMI